MNRLLVLPVLVLIFLIGRPAFSADLQKGLDAAERGDFASALKEWKPLAEQRDADAQYNQGLMYSRGDGDPKDFREELKWHRKAAEQGFAPAQPDSGAMYEDGEGVPQDNAEAKKWFRLATTGC